MTQSDVIEGAYARAPQISFLLSEDDGVEAAEPVTYESDRTGEGLSVYSLSGTGTLVPNDRAIREIVDNLAADAMKEIHARGYFDAQAIRETR